MPNRTLGPSSAAELGPDWREKVADSSDGGDGHPGVGRMSTQKTD